MSTEFQTYLRKEGVRHELTVPKTPEQNGVAERMNRTLVEGVPAMLADAGLHIVSGQKHCLQLFIFETEVLQWQLKE